MTESKTLRVRADFNGLFGELLCLSHKDTCEDVDGNLVTLRTGMVLTAFDEDADEHGNRDDLIASGIVEPSPPWLLAWRRINHVAGGRSRAQQGQGTGQLERFERQSPPHTFVPRIPAWHS